MEIIINPKRAGDLPDVFPTSQEVRKLGKDFICSRHKILESHGNPKKGVLGQKALFLYANGLNNGTIDEFQLFGEYFDLKTFSCFLQNGRYIALWGEKSSCSVDILQSISSET